HKYSEQYERVLEARGKKESVLGVHEQDGADHVDREQDRGDPRKEAEHQRDTGEQFDEGDERRRERRERHTELREALRHPTKPEHEQLLRTVGDEYDADDDAENGQSERQSLWCSRGDAVHGRSLMGWGNQHARPSL